MLLSHRLSKLIVGWTLLAALLLPARAQPSGAEPEDDADQIVAKLVARNQEGADLLPRYEGCRCYSLNYVVFPSNKSAEMLVALKYNATTGKEFSVIHELGAHPLVSRVLRELLVNEKEAQTEQHRRGSALTPQNYKFRPAGADTINVLSMCLKLSPASGPSFCSRDEFGWMLRTLP